MNRRNALKSLSILAGGVGLSLAGLKFYHLYQRPDLQWLGSQIGLLDELAETILPATDSPGAKAAGAGPFIFRMIKDCTDRKSQNNFIHGLAELKRRSEDHFHLPYESCTVQQRTEILRYFQKEPASVRGLTGKIRERLEGESFFALLKRYTVLGYCSSKPGATEGLRYDYIPGKYVGSVVLKPGDKAWATW